MNKDYLRVFRAFSDERRLRVLERLLALDRGGEDEATAFFRAMRESLEDDDREESV